MSRSETECQLYLVLPPDVTHGSAVQLAESAARGNIACALLQSKGDGLADRVDAAMLLRFAHAANIPLLLENDIAAAVELGADGVHIPADEDLYTKARKALGEDAIIGVECGFSRHDGLTLGEMGADYVAFTGPPGETRCQTNPELESIIGWWSETVTVPSVAWDTPTAAAAGNYSRAGADFVAMGEPIWSHAEGAASAAAEFNATLSEQKASA